MIKQLRVIISIFLVIASLSYSPKSEALVGVIIDNTPTKWVGGGITAAGVILFGIGLAAGKCAFGCNSTDELGVALIGLVYGVLGTGLGLVVLDEQAAYPLEFVQIFPDELNDLPGLITDEDLFIYNDEVHLLNKMNSELRSIDPSSKDAAQFNDYFNQRLGELAPETQKVFQAVVNQQM